MDFIKSLWLPIGVVFAAGVLYANALRRDEELAVEKSLPQIHESNHVSLGADYTPEEFEFLQAIDRYKRENRRPYPTWREVLEVVHALGYRKIAATEVSQNPGN